MPAAYAVEATEFPDLARRYGVNGVPKTVVAARAGGDDTIEILGALPQDDFVERIPEFGFETQAGAPAGELDVAHLWPASRQVDCHGCVFLIVLKPPQGNLQPSDGSTKRILVMVVALHSRFSP